MFVRIISKMVGLLYSTRDGTHDIVNIYYTKNLIDNIYHLKITT